MPLLMRGLDLPDPGLRANVLDTLNDATSDGTLSSIISDYASNLVTIMLKLSKRTLASGESPISTRDEAVFVQ
jgi:DNA repair/transcription protein MET18/MMS19